MTEEQTAARWGIDREQLASFVGVVARPQSYKNILYLGLAFFLGYLYFVLYLLALIFGVVFAIVGVGLLILFGALVGSRLLARFERWQANTLLGTDIEEPPPVPTDDGAWETAVAYATDHPTWRGVGFLALKFWLGLVSFLLVFVGFVVVLALLVPFGEAEVFGWTIDTTLESLLAMPLGLLLLFVVFHLCNAVASLSGTAATALLGPGDSHESPAARSTDRTDSTPSPRPVAESGAETPGDERADSAGAAAREQPNE